MHHTNVMALCYAGRLGHTLKYSMSTKPVPAFLCTICFCQYVYCSDFFFNSSLISPLIRNGITITCPFHYRRQGLHGHPVQYY